MTTNTKRSVTIENSWVTGCVPTKKQRVSYKRNQTTRQVEMRSPYSNRQNVIIYATEYMPQNINLWHTFGVIDLLQGCVRKKYKFLRKTLWTLNQKLYDIRSNTE